MGQELSVLLVEDNPADVYLLQWAARENQAPVQWVVAATGRKAWDCLEKAVSGAMPNLLILDLNLPGFSGREILAKMEQVPELRKVPVAVFTTSENEAGIVDDFPAMKVMFAVKTSDLQRLAQLVDEFTAFARGEMAGSTSVS